MMWVNMLNEEHRELNYMAQLAGITAQIVPRADHILFTLDGYNDNIEFFVEAFFKSLQTF